LKRKKDDITVLRNILVWNPSSELIRRYINLSGENSLKTKIESSDISKKNKKILINFYENCIATGLTMVTTLHYLRVLLNIGKSLNRNFDGATQQDIERVVAKIEKTGYKESTKNRYKMILKKFYKWLGKPRLVEKIKIKRVYSHLNPRDLLTKEEIEKMIEAADNSRNKALIWVLWESGCRISELLSIKIKDLVFDKHGAVLTIHNMKGSRKLRLKDSCPSILSLLRHHPSRDDPDSFLWITNNSKNNKVISYTNVRAMLKRLAKKAGINKRVNTFAFRHSRAVQLAQFLPESMLCKFFDWHYPKNNFFIFRPNSKDLDDFLLKEVYRIVDEDKNTEKQLEGRPKYHENI